MMQVDYLRKNLAPHGKHLHERLVDYARSYIKINLDYPDEYIQKDVQVGKDSGHGSMQIVDIACIPDGRFRVVRTNPYPLNMEIYLGMH